MPINSILIPQYNHIPLTFLIIPPFLLFYVFFHPPLQTIHNINPDLKTHLKKHITSLKKNLHHTNLYQYLQFLFIKLLIILYYKHTSNLFKLF